MLSNILKRLEALEAAQNSAGLAPAVSFMESMEGGTWHLSCGLWDGKKDSRTECSTHRTEDEARAAYDAFLNKYGRGKRDSVLIIDDL